MATPFTGSLDGDQHVIRHYTNTAQQSLTGLFGVVDGPTALIAHLAVVDYDIDSSELSGGLVGLLVSGTVTDVAALGGACTLRSPGYANHRGTLIGELRSAASLTDAYSTCAIDVPGNGGGGVGGLVGHNEGGTIARTYYRGTSTLTDLNGNYVGGLVGFSSGTVDSSFADVSVHGSNGGTVSLLVGLGTATASYFASNRSCTDDIGTCAVVGTPIDLGASPTYFNTATNPPMSGWDFATVWRERTNDTPTLRWLP
jgi:hypothetical protein